MVEWCAQRKQRGAEFTTSSEPSAGFSQEQRFGHRARFPWAGTRNDTRRSCSKKAAAWRSLRRLVAQAVGNLAAWRKVRTKQYTLQRSVHTDASISLPDLGTLEPGWDFSSQEALSHTLRSAATCGDWAVQVGRAAATTLTGRGRRCLQNLQEHSRFGSRLHHPQGHYAAASRIARAIHRFAHALPGKAGELPVWF